MASFRAAKGGDIGDWPAWCWVPMAGAYAVVSGGSGRRLTPQEGLDIAVVAALSTWRLSQGIYEIDETLLDALWQTDLVGEIPVEVLHHLPEWCVYIATPGREAIGAVRPVEMPGFFAHLEHDMSDGRTELRLLLDIGGEADGGPFLSPIPLHVWVEGGLRGAVERFVEEVRFQSLAHDETLDEGRMAEVARVAMAAAPLVSLILYLCSAAAEMRDPKDPNHRPRRGAARAANSPTVWETGYYLGPALRSAYATAGDEPQGGTHASPRAHLRRAHWHTVLSGTGRLQRELRWFPPIAVNVDRGAAMPTIRKVTPP